MSHGKCPVHHKGFVTLPQSCLKCESFTIGETCVVLLALCRLTKQAAESAEKAAQASAALPSIRASLQQARSQAAVCTQKAEGLRLQKQRMQVTMSHSRTIQVLVAKQRCLDCAQEYESIPEAD